MSSVRLHLQPYIHPPTYCTINIYFQLSVSTQLSIFSMLPSAVESARFDKLLFCYSNLTLWLWGFSFSISGKPWLFWPARHLLSAVTFWRLFKLFLDLPQMKWPHPAHLDIQRLETEIQANFGCSISTFNFRDCRLPHFCDLNSFISGRPSKKSPTFNSFEKCQFWMLCGKLYFLMREQQLQIDEALWC